MLRPNRDKSRIMKDAQMAGDTGLVNARIFHDIANLTFTRTQRLDDAATRWIRDSLKGIYMHHYVYVSSCI